MTAYLDTASPDRAILGTASPDAAHVDTAAGPGPTPGPARGSGGYLRQPSISGDTVVFCCEDDLWLVAATGGTARRLTCAAVEASRPRLSPDGATVAFVAAEDGPTEVYALPLSGGPAQRLTYQAARCAVVGWHPRTGEIIYASTAQQPAGFGYRLFAIDPSGGPTRLLGHGPASSIAWGPDGGTVLGRSIAEPARWKRYRGGAGGRLWIDRADSGDYKPLICLPGNLADPCWVGDRIYFLSDHDGIANVYSCHPDGSGLARHSSHTEFYARNLAADGGRLVYHAGAELFLIDPADGDHDEDSEARHIPVTLTTDRALRARRLVPAADHLDGATLSPDGSTLALIARGKPFTLEPWSGPVHRLGAADGVRYRLLNWLGDGRRLIAVAADERRDERLALLSADGERTAIEIPLGDLGHITELAAAPVGTLVALATNRQQLWTVDVDAAAPAPRLIDSSAHERIEELAWSPDGRWLAYTHPNSPRTSAIKVAEASRGAVFQVTRPILRDSSPVFDPCGRYLYFLSQRDLTAEADRVQFEVGFPFGARPYLAVLRAGEPAAFRGPNPPPGAEPQSESPDEPPTVHIDFDGLDRRVVPMPVAEGRYAGIVALPRSVLLLTVPVLAPDPKRPGAEPEGTVASVDLATGEVIADYLEPVDEISVSRTNDVLLYRWNDRLRVLSAGVDQDTAAEFLFRGAPATRQSGWIDLGRVMVSLDPAAEWRQMFREAWRLQRESFWNADMAGADWDGVYERYLPLAVAVSCRSELSDLLWELQGELATSHAYERDGDYRRPDEHAQGFLGVDWDVERPRGGGVPRWRVGRILRGDPWNADATSPCSRPGADVQEGDAVVAINGQPIGPLGPGELLVGQAGRDVQLTLHRDSAPTRRAVVRALGNEAGARYRDWVERQREQVHEDSSGRLGYVHVPDMFATGYTEFVRGFLAELDREGLVVDVRFNSGGHVSPLLLDRLARRRAGTEQGRWSGAAPYPAEAPRGPMAALINEHTGSDGEIFSHLFRARGFGSLIGARTWGGVIATWPRHRLVDGTLTTQPEFRYFFRGVGDGLENRGVEPDIEVETGPCDHDVEDGGHDVQLAAAIHHLLGILDEQPPVETGVGQFTLDLVAARSGQWGG